MQRAKGRAVATAGSPAIDIIAFRKSFGRHRALDGVTLSVAAGEMVALIGASGSGKSTLLRNISCLLKGDPVDGSRIAVQGRTVQQKGRVARDIRRRRASIGVVFQQFNLVSRLSVLKNVLCGSLARMPGWRTLLHWFTREQQIEALKALDRVGIVQHAFKRASELSGGQQQRAAIARAIMQKAEIVLADEPIASLDPESARIIMDLLQDLNRDGVTVVVSLHQVDFAMRYCPRTVALKEGRVVYDGPSAALTPERLRELYGSTASELFGSEPGLAIAFAEAAHAADRRPAAETGPARRAQRARPAVADVAR
ncbi:MAG: phosphonate ABC transporter ATP-binding protein [Rhodospirillaceae bacterium]|nr:phosphonate ABC transporter ATP-binding protein [Rhodospirillaceae bacterium]